MGTAPLTAEDFHVLAAARLPRAVLDYVDGGTEDELTLAWNREAFRRWAFVPAALADVRAVSTAAGLFGMPMAAPIGLAPTGYSRMMHPDGERAIARAAAAVGLPYTASTMATTRIEDAAAAAGTAPWYQLYLQSDEGVTLDLVDRAAAIGSPVLVVTIDTHVASNRLRDARNGLTIPPRRDDPADGRDAYWAALAAAEPLTYAQLAASAAAGTSEVPSGANAAALSHGFDAGFDWAALDRLRARWAGRLVLKGPIGAADAARAVGEHGVDGVWLSNHGGRQLDRVIPALDLLPEVRRALPDATVLVDSGVRSGSDAALAVALGADAAFVGRPYVWALAAGGQAGVERLLTILLEELTRTLGLLGCPDVAALRRLGPALVRPRR